MSSDTIPSDRVLQNAVKKAMEDDRPICLDYFKDSLNGTAFIGQNSETKERLLIKSSEEYTSMITKIFKVDECYLILTENSLYIVSSEIKARIVSGGSSD
jgi:hypothetical protein